MIVDKKTGLEVKVGDNLIRKNYKGFKTRYEVLDIRDDYIHVRKLDAGDEECLKCGKIKDVEETIEG